MSFTRLKESKNKEYLGFCNQKGYIYSIETAPNQYAVVSVAVRDNQVTTLIEYSVKTKTTN
jgi:hypothetical protein